MKLKKPNLSLRKSKSSASNTNSSRRTQLPSLDRSHTSVVFGLLFAILVTSMLISAILIALPKTERWIPDNRFDLNVKEDQYWSKSFTLELKVKEADKDQTTEKVELTKGVIQRRLDRYKVEQIEIRNLEEYNSDESGEQPEDLTELVGAVEQKAEEESVQGASDENDSPIKKYIQIDITGSPDQANVTRLIGSRHYLKIMTAKPEASNTDDQLAPYLPDNYERTEFTRRSFRNVEIKQLPTLDGSEAYFAIYKAWPQNAIAWRSFLGENAGKTIGIAIDGFVTPYDVPIEFDPDLKNPQQNPVFAPGVTQDAEEAKILDILYNSGVIPLEYAIIDSKDIDTTPYDLNSIEVSAAFILAVIVVMAYTYFRNREDGGRNLLFMLTSVSVFAIYVALLKMTSTPIDLPILLLEGLTIILLAKVLSYRTRSILLIDLPIIMFFALLSLYGSGYIAIYGMQMVVISLAIVVIVPILDTYIDKMRNLLLK